MLPQSSIWTSIDTLSTTSLLDFGCELVLPIYLFRNFGSMHIYFHWLFSVCHFLKILSFVVCFSFSSGWDLFDYIIYHDFSLLKLLFLFGFYSFIFRSFIYLFIAWKALIEEAYKYCFLFLFSFSIFSNTCIWFIFYLLCPICLFYLFIKILLWLILLILKYVSFLFIYKKNNF